MCWVTSTSCDIGQAEFLYQLREKGLVLERKKERKRKKNIIICLGIQSWVGMVFGGVSMVFFYFPRIFSIGLPHHRLCSNVYN